MQVLTHREILRGDLDIDALVRAVPPDLQIKGAFIASNAAIVAPVWSSVEGQLSSPPRAGKYLAFGDYPLADYIRVTDAAARRKYPKVGTREAHRLLSRNVFEVFSGTTLGKVTMSLTSGPTSVLLKYEDIFNRMVSGTKVTVQKVSPTCVDVEYFRYFSTQEAIFGVFEGVVLQYNGTSTITVKVGAQGRAHGHYLARIEWALG